MVKLNEAENELEQLQKTIHQLENVIEFTEKENIRTFQIGRYTDEIREVCMTLLTEGNISLRRFAFVISTVCKNLTGSLPERLPRPALLSCRFIVEAKIIVYKQAAKEMLVDFNPEGNCGSTLHQDATTFAHRHFEGMQATLQSELSEKS